MLKFWYLNLHESAFHCFNGWMSSLKKTKTLPPRPKEGRVSPPSAFILCLSLHILMWIRFVEREIGKVFQNAFLTKCTFVSLVSVICVKTDWKLTSQMFPWGNLTWRNCCYAEAPAKHPTGVVQTLGAGCSNLRWPLQGGGGARGICRWDPWASCMPFYSAVSPCVSLKLNKINSNKTKSIPFILHNNYKKTVSATQETAGDTVPQV